MNDIEHTPVLLDELIQALNIRADGIYIDATYGRGGHSREIMRRLDKSGRLLAIDRDPQAVTAARKEFSLDPRFRIEQGAFSRLGQFVEQHGWNARVNGVVLDLGVSSPQLEDSTRGFSFRVDGPLDMRMDPHVGVSAADWLRHADEREIAGVIREYGEERYARRIARAIVHAQREQPIATTGRLAHIVAAAVPRREPGKDPATRTFQAIRMHVNRELGELADVLPQAVRALAPAGRLAVISFHSLEDRMVKRFFQSEARGGELPPELPLRAIDVRARLRIVGKAMRASAEEVARNPRARSAILRVAERTEVAA